MPNIKKAKQTEFKKTLSYKPKDSREHQLADAFLMLKTKQEVFDLLRDLMTTAEIQEFAKRLEIARLLYEGDKSYLEIAKEVGTSTTTVTRVAQWLYNGCGGYAKVLRDGSSDE